MNAGVLFFGVWPYLALVVFVVGHVWRWRTDQFGWTARPSGLSEKRWLGLGSPLFHGGALLVVLGHMGGLIVPASMTRAMGVPDEVYHLVAISMGLLSGAIFTVGAVLLAMRRFLLGTRIRIVTRPGDVVVYVILGLQIVFGFWETVGYSLLGALPGFDYRESVSIWFRSVFYGNPAIELISGAPLVFQVHAFIGFAIFAVWPFSRLVHVWSVPIGYLTRPLIVYRADAKVRRTTTPVSYDASGARIVPTVRAR